MNKDAFHFFTTGLLLLLLLACSCQQPADKTAQVNAETPDSTMRVQLGADDYGMKQYSLVFLKRGANSGLSADSLAQIQKAHLKYLRSQMDTGKLLVLGPLMADEDIRGICIYNCSPEEARAISEKDPAVVSGHLSVEAFGWYGTAALQQVPELHQKIETKSFDQIM